MWVNGLDWAGPGQGQVVDACECGNEPSGSVKCGDFLDQLQTSQLLKKDSAPWSKKVTHVKGRKGKLHPRTGHEGPEGEQRYSATLSLTSSLDWVGGQRHTPAALPLGKRPGTRVTGGWVGPRAGLDGCGKSRSPHRESIPGPSRPQRVATPTELSRLTTQSAIYYSSGHNITLHIFRMACPVILIIQGDQKSLCT